MGTVVYQGLHEAQLVEPRAPNILRLRLLSSSRPHYYPSFLELPLKSRALDSGNGKLCVDAECQYEEFSQKANTVHKSSNIAPDSGGWSFLQALDNGFGKPENSKEQSTYVHPLVKLTSSRLSEKSLELCTERLGSESGSDIIEDSIFSSPSHVGDSPTSEQKIMKPRQPFGANTKASISRSFPPPLTTMSGSKSIQVRPHREDGRLVIEAIKNPSTQTCFQTERSHGRLRLTFVKDFTSIFNSTNVPSLEDKNEEEENENDLANYDADQEYEEQQEEETEDEEDEEQTDDFNMEVGDEMGMDELQTPTRCSKQGELDNQKGIISNWEHLCVATS